MSNRFPLADQPIDGDDIQTLIDWLQSNPWLTQGPLVSEFEQRWSSWLGVNHSVFVNSGSSANLLMYYSLLMQGNLKNKKVVVPAVSWATTVAPAIQLGFEPLLCEASTTDFGLDMGHFELLLKEHDPSAVIIVHVLGVPNNMETLMALKDKYGFVLMEDTCAATGSKYDGQLVGTFGEMSTFSFYYGHHLSTIEGGMISTSNESLNDILLQIRSHGWGKSLTPEKQDQQAKEHGVTDFNRPFSFYYPGFNVRSTDLNARIGLSQLDKIDNVLSRRIENHKIYQARFSESPLHFQKNDRAIISSIAFAALASSVEHRKSIAEALREAGVETRPLGGGNMSAQPFWSKIYGNTSLTMADRIHETAFQLPNHPILSPDDINSICDVVLSVPDRV